MSNTIYFPRWMEVLVRVGEGSNMHQVAVELQSSYSQVFSIMRDLEKIGYCTSRRVGRARVWNFTDKGKEVKNIIGLLNLKVPSATKEGRRQLEAGEVDM